MQIKVDLKIFIIAVIFVLTKQIEIYSMFMLFILIHELGHMICGILLGLKIKSIYIMPLGITAVFETYKNIKIIEIKKIIISLAGPITNLIIAVIGIFLNLNSNIIFCNVTLALFNMLPLYPLDGGRTLKSVLSITYGTKRASIITNKISNIIIIILTSIASIAILILKNIAILFTIMYLWYIVITENKKFNLKTKIYKLIEKQQKYLQTK